MDISNPSDSALFPSLCNLASFVVNDSKKMFTFVSELTPGEVSVLISILTSGAEIECFGIHQKLPAGTGAELGEAIRRSGRIGTLLVGSDTIKYKPSPELSRLVAASPNPTLEQLKIRCLQIDDERMNQLCGGSSGNQQLTMLRSLKIQYCQFNIVLLTEWISSLRALETLSISGVMFSPSRVGALAAALRRLPAVTDLSLREVEIEAEGWQQLGSGFFGRLWKLNLSRDRLGDEKIAMIVNAILVSRRRRCELRELHLNGNSFGPAGARKIEELIACSPHLRYMDLGHNKLETEIAPQTFRGCVDSLEVLEFGNCMMGSSGIVSLLVCDYYALTTLEIYMNGIGNLGARAIAQFLLHHGGRTLKVLDARYNCIEEAGALELAEGLVKAYAIRSINMGMNPLGPRGAPAMLDALATVSEVSMDLIDFAGCNIGNAGASAAGKIIMRRGCRLMSLEGNNIHAKGARVIADSINSSAVLISNLNLEFNDIGDYGTTYLLTQIARENRFIRSLKIDALNIGVEGAMAIRRAMKAQGALKELVYGGYARVTNAIAILREVEGVRPKSDD